MENDFCRTFSVLRHHFSGGCVKRATPVPIPNTEVKPLGADGTARATVWESRKPPGLNRKARERNLAGFFVILLQSITIYAISFRSCVKDREVLGDADHRNKELCCCVLCGGEESD